jgi:NADPH:quinone reductase
MVKLESPGAPDHNVSPAGIAALPMNLPLLKSCDILGINWRTFTMSQPEENHSNRATLLQMYSRGEISPVITATFPLKRGGEAIARLKERGAVGKIVVTN